MDGNGDSVLHLAAGHGPLEARLEAVKVLLAGGADVRVPTGSGMSILQVAARAGNAEVVKALVQHGVNATAAQEDGWHALHEAANCDWGSVIEVLIEAGLTQRLKLTTTKSHPGTFLSTSQVTMDRAKRC